MTGIVDNVDSDLDSMVLMLTNQLELQKHLGYDFSSMSDEERICYVKEMCTALISEVVEALNEVEWKSWRTKGTEAPRFNTLPFLSELNDIGQFLMNLWLVAMPNATPEQIVTSMMISLDTKMIINYARDLNVSSF